MGKLAVIGGSGFQEYTKKGVVYLQRHRGGKAPHQIDHKANLLLLKKKDVTSVIGVCSVGSLKLYIRPGSLLIPHDYINLSSSQTFFDRFKNHIIPHLDQKLRKQLIQAGKKARLKVIPHGIYFQMRGPRFETKAEIILLSDYADVVGMTMAEEATLAQELGMNYAALCSVDNYAHGMVEKALTYQGFRKMQQQNKSKIVRLLEAFL